MTEVSKWLDKEFNHNIIPINYRLTYKKIENYYFENSKEILINDINKIKDLNNLKSQIGKNPNTQKLIIKIYIIIQHQKVWMINQKV